MECMFENSSTKSVIYYVWMAFGVERKNIKSIRYGKNDIESIWYLFLLSEPRTSLSAVGTLKQ